MTWGVEQFTVIHNFLTRNWALGSLNFALSATVKVECAQMCETKMNRMGGIARIDSVL